MWREVYMWALFPYTIPAMGNLFTFFLHLLPQNEHFYAH